MKFPASLIKYRPARPEDVPFIMGAWVDSFRNSPFGRTLTDDEYKAKQEAHVTELLSNNDVLIACLAEDDDCLIGFICHGETPEGFTAIHYVYVKFNYRYSGIAQTMINRIKPTAPAVITQVNRKFEELRAVNFLPLITNREWEDLLKKNDEPQSAFNQWFIDQLPKLRADRAEIMKERNQRAFQRRNRTRVQ